MHPGIRKIAEKWLEDDERRSSLERILSFLIGYVKKHSKFHRLNAIDPYYQDIVELLEDRAVRDEFGELYAELVAWLGSYFYLRGLWDYGLNHLSRAAELTEQLEIRSGILWWLATIYVVKGKYDRAMDLYRKSLEIEEKIGDLKGKAATYHSMANIYVVKGEFDRAMDLYRKSLEIEEKIGDLQGKAATYHEMAYIYRVKGEYDRAMDLYRKSLEIEEKIGDLKGKSNTLVMLGQLLMTFVEEEKRVKGLAYIMQGFALLRKIGAAEAKSASNILKDAISLVPKSIHSKAMKMLSGEERRIVEKALRES